MKKITLGFALMILFFASPSFVGASIGVSNNTAKILLNEPLIAGASYDVPNIQITNTGTEASDFGASVEYNQTQNEMKPSASWINFSPSTFRLEPGESKIVKIKLNVPLSAQSGDYFSYIEAHSLKSDGISGTSIAGAASTKFYFTVAKSNMFLSMYYGILLVVHKNLGLSYIVLGLLAIGIVYLIVKRINIIRKSMNSKGSN